jgi:DNA mismatch endonuclease (patch repair protein)
VKEASEDRSRIMRAVKSRDTSPELTVRRLLHAMGYRFRLHRSDLPGNPDIVLPGRQKVLFVHGCFWHGHKCPRGDRVPNTNRDYWIRKIARNRERDVAARVALEKSAWQVGVVWECEIKDRGSVERQLRRFLR